MLSGKLSISVTNSEGLIMGIFVHPTDHNWLRGYQLVVMGDMGIETNNFQLTTPLPLRPPQPPRDEPITVTLTREQWQQLDREASLELGPSCEDDPKLVAIRKALGE